MTKKSAIEKYKPIAAQASKEEVATALKSDEKKYSDADIDEILNEIFTEQTPEAQSNKAQDTKGIADAAPQKKEQDQHPVKTQAEILGLDRFDYMNLRGDSYNEYKEMVGTKLKAFVQYHFDCYKARTIKKERYPGLKDSPWDVIGIQILSASPINSPKIEARHAINLNEQVDNSGLYYFLKK